MEYLKFNHYQLIVQCFKLVFAVFIQVKLFYFYEKCSFSLAIQTGRPTPAAIQAALNDLPTISPLSVSVSATSTLYIITFAVEMGDVPLLTCISTSSNIKKGIFLDTVSIRPALPNGYEDPNTFPIDQSATSSCIFPFYYNGSSYSACTLDEDNIPICADNNNQTYQCNGSSIEGIRRLYPKHQLVYDTLQLTYLPSSSQFTVSFRYSNCENPTQIIPWPSTVNTF
jgi:hypothetical protein